MMTTVLNLDGVVAGYGKGDIVKGEPPFYSDGQASDRAKGSRFVEGNPEAAFVPSDVTDFTAVCTEIYRAGSRILAACSTPSAPPAWTR